MKVAKYEVVVMQHQFIPDENRPEHNHHIATKSIVHALGYKDAKAVADSLETWEDETPPRSCTICIRLNVWGKSVLLPVRQINEDLVHSLIDVLNNRKNELVSDSADHCPVEDTMHRRLHSLDEVDQLP